MRTPSYKFHLHLKHSLSNITNKIQRYPLRASVAICTINFTLCDTITQTLIEGRNWQRLDKRRLLCFNQFGMWFIGVAQFFVFVRLFPKFFEGYLFGNHRKLGRILQISAATLVYCPFGYWPAFYIFKETFYDGFEIKSVNKACKVYFQENFWNDNIRAWRLWIPAHILTFTVVPPYLRPFWTNAVTFVWTMILSAYNGAPDESHDEDTIYTVIKKPLNVQES